MNYSEVMTTNSQKKNKVPKITDFFCETMNVFELN